MRLSACVWCAVLSSLVGTVAAQQPTGTKQEPEIGQPLTARERSAAVELTRLREARLWWNDQNRVIGASFKGVDANDHTLALASVLPGLRTVVLVATPQARLTDNGLSRLTTHPALELLSISGNRITDTAMVHVGQMGNLRTLVLNCDITDIGLEQLSELSNLERLDLTQSQITDAGMTQLKHFPRLKTLVLNGTHVTNASLPAIAELKALEKLFLGDTSIDDAAVAPLTEMKQLQRLFLLNTQMTTKAVEELQLAFPKTCTIVHQSGTYKGTATSPLAMATAPAQPETHVTPTTWRPAK